jgi:hypothetical protein
MPAANIPFNGTIRILPNYGKFYRLSVSVIRATGRYLSSATDTLAGDSEKDECPGAPERAQSDCRATRPEIQSAGPISAPPAWNRKMIGALYSAAALLWRVGAKHRHTDFSRIRPQPPFQSTRSRRIHRRAK